MKRVVTSPEPGITPAGWVAAVGTANPGISPRRGEPAYVPPTGLLIAFAALSANHGEPPGESVTPCGRFAMVDMAS